MTNSGNPFPVDPANSTEYNQAKNLAFSLGEEDLERLRNEIREEINRRAEELALRQREKEERERRKRGRELDALDAAWKPKHFARSDSEAEGSHDGFEYPVEEINTNEEDSDVAEEKKRMERYFDWKIRRRFDHERANPKICSRTMREGEPSDDDEELLDAAGDEDDEDEDSDESTSSEDDQTFPASSGSSYSAQYEEDEDWSYDEDDF
ncbi:protein bfr2-like [Papaver somniferum]|uniref:protein bfr2-like n=1 Tax=Papaver somniferum TaxID=3469 RepID=UPI000E6FB179|nr:protein bfr2-like [Papaver somniferum]